MPPNTPARQPGDAIATAFPGQREPEPEPASEGAIPPALTSVRWRLRNVPPFRPTWPRFYVFAHLKGGSGKSTSAGTIALRLHEHTGQPVLAIDIDTRSQTLTSWHATLGEDWPAGVELVTWPVADLEQRIAARLAGPNPPVHIVIDSGGHDTALLMAAVKAGRFPRSADGQPTVTGADVIVPMMPSDAEVEAITTTVDVVSACARLAKIRLRSVLTRVGPMGVKDLDYVRATEAMAAAGLPWTDTYISFLKKHLRAPGTLPQAVRDYDKPRDGDAGQYDSLLAELLEDEPLEVIS
jgi:hypothetical protein